MSENQSEVSRSLRWWGRFQIDAEDRRRWQIGPATVWIERRSEEWGVRHLSEGDPFSDRLEVAVPSGPAEPAALIAPLERFAGLSDGAGIVELFPRLADRDVVSRPEEPFSVVPGGSVTCHVGSPLWLQLGLGPDAARVTEFPLLRPSDTWFGHNTRIGKLCYASRTRLRLRRSDVRSTPHRAVTEVSIQNSGTTPLRIERINVPVPALSLWVDDTGMLRTSSITLDRKDDDDEIAELEIDHSTPIQSEPVAGPRAETSGGLVRAFSRLL